MKWAWALIALSLFSGFNICAANVPDICKLNESEPISKSMNIRWGEVFELPIQACPDPNPFYLYRRDGEYD